MLTKQFWADLLERAAKTAAQFVLVAIGGNLTNAWTLDWRMVAGTAAAGALTSVLTSVVSLPIGGSGTASLTNAVEPASPAGKHESR
jgi:Putative lactococcus lactis phage r1t holin